MWSDLLQIVPTLKGNYQVKHMEGHLPTPVFGYCLMSNTPTRNVWKF